MLIQAKTVVLDVANIDTDQIIPARFLTTTERSGLGRHAFADWRYRQDGSLNPEFPLNKPDANGARILVAGKNFGCGSSREHAPWALLDAGIQAVISSEIADIFRSNALKNGLIACVVDEHTHQALLADPGADVCVDLARAEVRWRAHVCSFPIDAFTQHCLLQGVDQLGFILQQQAAITAFEGRYL
jgi:3-isopropylmalate/(R)-2-methylmalate dehydratase small subunit